MPSFSSADFLLTILHSNKLPALSLDLALMVTWVFIGDAPIILLHQRLTGIILDNISNRLVHVLLNSVGMRALAAVREMGNYNNSFVSLWAKR
jgi:hypothetical protein